MTPCWEWPGNRDRDGYGYIKVCGKRLQAHRLMYEVLVGPIPEGFQVLHHCDNPPCWRPDHLFVGTHLDNVADRQTKGRHARGSRVAGAKLTEEQVLEIRRRYRLGGVSMGTLAREFGLFDTTAAAKIIKRVTWKHLP